MYNWVRIYFRCAHVDIYIGHLRHTQGIYNESMNAWDLLEFSVTHLCSYVIASMSLRLVDPLFPTLSYLFLIFKKKKKKEKGIENLLFDRRKFGFCI